jgi:hypothetical protein
MPAVLAVVASALAEDGGTAIALDDGTVWLVYDGEWDELGACADGEVTELVAEAEELAITCGDGTSWRWSATLGWIARPEDVELDATAEPLDRPWTRSWWPTLEVSVRTWRKPEPVLEGWIRLRWEL